ncbi:741_t:CDS:1 [Dentiscutata heterogama]|uniref:741_t:CDS:1 n=1 Tax=Dentiscutata heterogama TaxID=1316150 RepID=A0ACA9KAS5_9GLOM|nr:741_t:CDS:1 [Dentiscutata heterogama]
MANLYVPSSLTIDCLEEIIHHLVDHRSSLFSCLLVNRLWCKLAIGLLWSRPFEYHINVKRFSMIIKTYISCLPIAEKQMLRSKNKRILPEIPAERTLDIMDQKKVYSNKDHLLFNYPKYLRILDLSNFQNGVKQYLTTVNIESYQLVSYTVQILVNFLIQSTDTLHHLVINSPIMRLFFDITLLPNIDKINQKLSSISKIDLFLQRKDTPETHQGYIKLVSHISKHSRNLNKISIVNDFQDCQPEILRHIFRLIEIQNYLEEITIWEFQNPSTCQWIYTALKTQSHSLKYLGIKRFRNFSIFLDFLKSCKSLKSLEILDFFVEDGYTPFYIPFNSTVSEEIKLEKFSCCENYSKSSVFSLTMTIIIRMANKNLRELILGDSTDELIEEIQQNCPNIIKLSLTLYTTSFEKLLPLLSSSKLEFLYLESKFDSSALTPNFMQKLAISLPKTLLHLGMDLGIVNEGLRLFFEEYGNCGVALYTIELYNYLLDDRVLESITKYARKVGGLKRLKISEVNTNISEKGLQEAKDVISSVVLL